MIGYGARSIVGGDSLKAVIVELNGSGQRYGYSDDDVHGVLAAHGFAPMSYDPLSRDLTPLDGYNTGGNTIYVRDRAFVDHRIGNASARTIHGVRF